MSLLRAGTKLFVRSVIGPACSGTAYALARSPARPIAPNMRIPTQSGHLFRHKPATDSD